MSKGKLMGVRIVAFVVAHQKDCPVTGHQIRLGDVCIPIAYFSIIADGISLQVIKNRAEFLNAGITAFSRGTGNTEFTQPSNNSIFFIRQQCKNDVVDAHSLAFLVFKHLGLFYH